MQADAQLIPLGPLVSVHSESPGQVTARVVGLPELQATAATRAEALERLRKVVAEALASGRLALLDLARENSLMKWFGHARDDADFDDYLEEIRRYRQEVDDNLQPEMDDKRCPGSSSTPTT
jgi:hypothetical protein